MQKDSQPAGVGKHESRLAVAAAAAVVATKFAGAAIWKVKH